MSVSGAGKMHILQVRFISEQRQALALDRFSSETEQLAETGIGL
jgi:hypothetical protein